MTAHERSRHLLHGLVVEATDPIAALDSDRAPEVVAGPPEVRAVPSTPPPGEILFHGTTGWEIWIARGDDGGVVVRYSEQFEFRITSALDAIASTIDPRADPAFSGVLLHGAVMSVVHTMRGSHSLHATTVAIDGRGIALFGPSGRGKSTVAALLVAAGAVLVADDVTVLATDHPQFVRPGLLELRLREAAFGIGELIPDAATRTTADSRLAVRPHVSPPAQGVPLAAAVLPTPRRDGTSIGLTRFDPVTAITPLLSGSRLVGWQDPGILQQEFAAVTDLATSLPVFTLDVPWGPPFDLELADKVRDALERDALGA